ncbi:hypothetical protein [Spartinivicinus ruber]|uniref:hypothetical protein n=1 Tax=Spartinivicinus ruber TaxID=2683272 RepID=UPI0013D6D731|nr:hypothetical protein [Spartinivicinus ruber]
MFEKLSVVSLGTLISFNLYSTESQINKVLSESNNHTNYHLNLLSNEEEIEREVEVAEQAYDINGTLLGKLYADNVFIPGPDVTANQVLSRLGFDQETGYLMDVSYIGKTIEKLAREHYTEFSQPFAEALLKSAFRAVGLDSYFPYGTELNIKASIALRTLQDSLNPKADTATGEELLLLFDQLKPFSVASENESGSESDFITPQIIAAFMYLEVRTIDRQNLNFADAVFSLKTDKIVLQDHNGVRFISGAEGKKSGEIAEIIFGENNELSELVVAIALEEVGADYFFKYGSIYNVQATVAKKILLEKGVDISDYTPEGLLAVFYESQNNYNQVSAQTFLDSPAYQAALLLALIQGKNVELADVTYVRTNYELQLEYVDWVTQTDFSIIFDSQGYISLPSRKEVAQEILQSLDVWERLTSETDKEELIKIFLETGNAQDYQGKLMIGALGNDNQLFDNLTVKGSPYLGINDKIDLNDIWSRSYNESADKIIDLKVNTLRLDIFQLGGKSALDQFDQGKYYRINKVQRFSSQVIYDLPEPVFLGFKPKQSEEGAPWFKIDKKTGEVSYWDRSFTALYPTNKRYQTNVDELLFGSCRKPYDSMPDGVPQHVRKEELICHIESGIMKQKYQLYFKNQFIASKSSYKDLTASQIFINFLKGFIPGLSTLEAINEASGDDYADPNNLLSSLVTDSMSIIPSLGPLSKGAKASTSILRGTSKALARGAVKQGIKGLSKASAVFAKGLAKSLKNIALDASNLDIAMAIGKSVKRLSTNGLNRFSGKLISRVGNESIGSVNISQQSIVSKLNKQYRVEDLSSHVGQRVNSTNKLYHYLDNSGQVQQDLFALQINDGHYLLVKRGRSHNVAGNARTENLSDSSYYLYQPQTKANQHWLYKVDSSDQWTLHHVGNFAGGNSKTGYFYAPFGTEDIVNMVISDNATKMIGGKAPLKTIVDSSAYKDQFMNSLSKWASNEKNAVYFQLVKKIEDTAKAKNIPLIAEEILSIDQLKQILGESSKKTIYNYYKSYHIVKSYRWISKTDNVIDNKGAGKFFSTLGDDTKIYVQGHGEAASDLISTKNPGSAIDTSDLASRLKNGGLPLDYKDIRITSCWSADICQLTSFDKASTGMPSYAEFSDSLKPLAKSVSDAFKHKGFNQLKVTGYHGAGVVNSYEYGRHMLRVVFPQKGGVLGKMRKVLKKPPLLGKTFEKSSEARVVFE